jgi:uncharacterized protein (DUF2235 family)
MPNAPASMPPGDPKSDEWCHIRETVSMLYLAVCQIEATLRDSNTSVETLTNSFTALANHTNEVSEHVQTVKKPDELDSFKRDISETARELQTNISSSIQAFQFYDRVTQRLDHVCRSLENVSGLLECDEKITSVNEWRQVQNQIKSSYTMEAERIMFEFIIRGGSVKEALEIYSHHFEEDTGKTDQDNDEVELF